jgi:hypothetical protein
MRRKERSGPGIVTVSPAEGAVGAGAAGAETLSNEKAATKTANVRRGNFIIGYLFEKSIGPVT